MSVRPWLEPFVGRGGQLLDALLAEGEPRQCLRADLALAAELVDA